jgi:putative transposase
MSKKRRQYSAKYKFQVALEAAKGQKTISELASEHSIHPNQIREWKQKLMNEGDNVFGRKNGRRDQEQAAQEAELYEQIGRLKMELEWLKKKVSPFN